MDENNYIVGFFEGTVLEKGYGYISREIMRNPGISKGAKVIYCYLLSFAGDRFTAFPKVKTVCKELCFKNQGTYYKYLNELKENGLLYTELVKNEKGKWDKNLFYLTRNKSDIEKVKSQNKKVKYEFDKNVKPVQSIDNSNSEPDFKNCSTENCSTKNLSTNINTLNKNNINIILEDEEVLKSYREVKGRYLNSKEKEKLRELLNIHSKDLILKAIDVMVTDAEKITLKYIQTVLDDWKAKGIQTVTEVEKDRLKWQETKNKENNKPHVKDKKISTFNNFKQRDYDFDDLKKKLIKHDKENLKEADCNKCSLYRNDRCIMVKKLDENNMCPSYIETGENPQVDKWSMK